MKIQDIKYIADQILGYNSLIFNKKFIKKLVSEIKTQYSYSKKEGGKAYWTGKHINKTFPSEYQKPINIHINFSIGTKPLEEASITTDILSKNLYIQLRITKSYGREKSIKRKQGTRNKIIINIRNGTRIKLFDNIGINPRRRLRNLVAKLFDLQNLIIIDKRKPKIDEVRLQLGIYTYRNKFFTDKPGLYFLYYEVMKKNGANIEIDDTVFFERLLKNYIIPSHSKALERYMVTIKQDIYKKMKSKENLRDPLYIEEHIDKYNSKNYPRNINDFGDATARFYNIPPSTIYTLIGRNKINPKKRNNKYIYDEDYDNQIKKILDQRKQKKIIRDLTLRYSESKGISFANASRTIHNWRKTGMSNEEMFNKIKNFESTPET